MKQTQKNIRALAILRAELVRRRDRRDNGNSYRVIRSTRFEFIGTEVGEGVPIL